MQWKFTHHQIKRITGLAGVSPHETEQARRWAERLEWPMLVVAFWIPVQWYLEEVGLLDRTTAKLGDWFVWLAFVIESFIILLNVQNRWYYLANNWMNVAIILTGIMIVWGYTPVVAVLRSLRVLLVIGLLLRISSTMMEVLKQNNLGNLLIFVMFILVVSGLLISTIDPAIENPWQGVWWALVSITTVGYGDVVPVSGAGKFFASLLIILGIVAMSLLTANVSAFLVRRSGKEEDEETQDLLRDIVRKLDKIEGRLKKLEQEQDSERSASTHNKEI